jgi:mutator protein MutT
MLIEDNHVLAEKRKRTKQVMPGSVALPGGHLEAGEQADEALRREVQEELGIVPLDVVYVCTLLHRSQEFRKLHYFTVTRWQGEMQIHEAEAVLWIPLHALSRLDLDVDRMAVTEYVRCLHIVSAIKTAWTVPNPTISAIGII